MEILATGGLTVIFLGWVLQFLNVYSGKKELNKDFLVIYALGVLIIAYDAYGSDMLSPAVLNLGCMVMALLTMWKLK